MKKTNNPLTLQERIIIEKYIKQGFSCTEISKIIFRGVNTVVSEVRRSGGRETYCAKDAQRLSEIRMENKYERLSERNKGRATVFHIKQRIENLEMQLEILHETIKEIMKK